MIGPLLKLTKLTIVVSLSSSVAVDTFILGHELSIPESPSDPSTTCKDGVYNMSSRLQLHSDFLGNPLCSENGPGFQTQSSSEASINIQPKDLSWTSFFDFPVDRDLSQVLERTSMSTPPPSDLPHSVVDMEVEARRRRSIPVPLNGPTGRSRSTPPLLQVIPTQILRVVSSHNLIGTRPLDTAFSRGGYSESAHGFDIDQNGNIDHGQPSSAYSGYNDSDDVPVNHTDSYRGYFISATSFNSSLLLPGRQNESDRPSSSHIDNF